MDESCGTDVTQEERKQYCEMSTELPLQEVTCRSCQCLPPLSLLNYLHYARKKLAPQQWPLQCRVPDVSR